MGVNIKELKVNEYTEVTLKLNYDEVMKITNILFGYLRYEDEDKVRDAYRLYQDWTILFDLMKHGKLTSHVKDIISLSEEEFVDYIGARGKK